MKVVVTGAYGFIGRSLCVELLKRNFFVHGVVRVFNKNILAKNKNLKVTSIGDISSKTNWIKTISGAKCIIHCAAKTRTIQKKLNKNSIYLDTNVEGTLNLAKQAANLGVKRLIFLSSAKVNGEFTLGSSSFKNTDQSNPEDQYSNSKFIAEKELLKISHQTGLEVVIIRSPLVYGEGVKGNFLKLLDLVYKGIPLPFSNVNNLRSLVGLDNLIDLIICCISVKKARGKTFLVSDNEDISTTNLVKKIAKFMKKPTRLFYLPQNLLKFLSLLIDKTLGNRLLNSFKLNISHTNKVLRWTPPVSLDKGLKKTIKWYLNNR